MAEISKISDKATKIKYSNNVLYYFAFGTIIVHGDNMEVKFFNGVQQHFKFSDFTTSESDFESYIDSLISLDYFRVNTTGGVSTGGSATDINQLLQIAEAEEANTHLESLILGDYTQENIQEEILKELKIQTKLLRKILE